MQHRCCFCPTPEGKQAPCGTEQCQSTAEYEPVLTPTLPSLLEQEERGFGIPVCLGQHGSSSDERVAYTAGRYPNAVYEPAYQIQISGFDADGRELVQEACPVEIRHPSSGLLDLFDEARGSRKVSARLFDECSHGERRNQDLRITSITCERHELLDKNGGLGSPASTHEHLRHIRQSDEPKLARGRTDKRQYPCRSLQYFIPAAKVIEHPRRLGELPVPVSLRPPLLIEGDPRFMNLEPRFRTLGERQKQPKVAVTNSCAPDKAFFKGEP